jgi:cytochrome P450
MATATVERDASAKPVRLAGQPLIGHLAQFRRDPLGLLERCRAAPGPVVEMRIRARTYALKTAEDVRHVIVSNTSSYEKPARLVGARGERVGGRGVFFSPAGPEHRRGRGLLRPPLGREGVLGLDAEIVAGVDRALESWPDGEAIDLGRETTALAFRNMLKGIFGARPEESPELAEGIAAKRWCLEQTVRVLIPRPGFIPVTLSPARRRALRRLDQTLLAMLARERSAKDPPVTTLASLARAMDRADGEASAREARDQLVNIGVTGYMTVGAALTWSLYELACNPDMAARLETEVDEELGDRAPVAADAERLSYAEMVIAEALRMYPPTWAFWRMVRADDELPSGTRLRAGAKVMLSPYLVQRSPTYYEQPERFDPERMEPARIAERPRFAYFPFGGGRRVCVGRDFALLELTLMLARLAQRVRFELLSGQAALYPYLNLRPRQPIEMRVTRR